MRFITTFTALVASVATAAPLNDVSARQVDWSAVGELYSGGGCTSQSLIFADPIFGAANVCHPLDRFGNQPPIVSYKTVSTSPGCTVALYFDLNCTVPATGFPSPVNQCTQGNSPFEAAIVTCPTN